MGTKDTNYYRVAIAFSPFNLIKPENMSFLQWKMKSRVSAHFSNSKKGL